MKYLDYNRKNILDTLEKTNDKIFNLQKIIYWIDDVKDTSNYEIQEYKKSLLSEVYEVASEEIEKWEYKSPKINLKDIQNNHLKNVLIYLYLIKNYEEQINNSKAYIKESKEYLDKVKKPTIFFDVVNFFRSKETIDNSKKFQKITKV